MSLPAGWLATRFGYKGGIIFGLLLVAVGGFWFIPATKIVSFWAFLLGVCLIASGLTFLETVANPYTTVLGPQQFAATRINLAQSCNGVGWILGPIAGATFFYSKDAAGKSTGNQTLWIPYAGVGVVVIVLAAIFCFADVPDIKPEDDHSMDDSKADMPHSIWSRPHFTMAVAAQFFYVAAQAGIFSFLINYMTTQPPPIPASWGAYTNNLATDSPRFLRNFFLGWFEPNKEGILCVSNKLASYLASFGFVCFLTGRFSGAVLLRKYSAHKMLGLYGGMNVLMCMLVFCKLGWFSVVCVFLSYFFMSIMFPTIFALGIFGLGTRAKKASAYIVMAIMGGALLPKVMGSVADRYDMSRAFIVPLACFIFIAYYGYNWPKFSKAESLHVVDTARGHLQQ
jgi:FHS family L-fucose permease-like MFS transporter